MLSGNRAAAAELIFVREKEQDLYYSGVNVCTRRADLIVNEKIMVELKATINIEDVHLAQTKNYVVAYDLPVGLLINFGSTVCSLRKSYIQI